VYRCGFGQGHKDDSREKPVAQARQQVPHRFGDFRRCS
jgi:hypothetical protein